MKKVPLCKAKLTSKAHVIWRRRWGHLSGTWAREISRGPYMTRPDPYLQGPFCYPDSFTIYEWFVRAVFFGPIPICEAEDTRSSFHLSGTCGCKSQIHIPDQYKGRAGSICGAQLHFRLIDRSGGTARPVLRHRGLAMTRNPLHIPNEIYTLRRRSRLCCGPGHRYAAHARLGETGRVRSARAAPACGHSVDRWSDAQRRLVGPPLAQLPCPLTPDIRLRNVTNPPTSITNGIGRIMLRKGARTTPGAHSRSTLSPR